MYNPQRLLLGEATFTVEVLLKESQIRLAAIMSREKLILGGRFKCWRLDVCSKALAAGLTYVPTNTSHLCRLVLVC